jgi:glycosyltransferase involved in cell wall biosynthesis
MPDIYPKISIVTPVFNQEEFIEDCIRSILDQNYPNLEYLIIDGSSTDGTTDIIKKYAGKIQYWVSESDNGLYHALQKGFQKTTGEIMGWLNSDDILLQHSLFTIAEIFGNYSDINWLQGLPTVIDNQNRIVYSRRARQDKYEFLMKDYHDGIFIQQESTYWRRNLWEKAGSFISTDYNIAGDFELWMRFFEQGILYGTDALIGSFRYRGKGQMSKDNYPEYLDECDKIVNAAVSRLSGDELSIFKKKLKMKRMKERYPLFSKITTRMGATDKANNEVYFDFKDYKFKKT